MRNRPRPVIMGGKRILGHAFAKYPHAYSAQCSRAAENKNPARLCSVRRSACGAQIIRPRRQNIIYVNNIILQYYIINDTIMQRITRNNVITANYAVSRR